VPRDWILAAAGGREAYDRLASGLASSDLWSVLLEVVRARARARTPSELLAQYRRDPFVRPGLVDQRESHAVDGHLFAAAADFEALELSPVTPLGTCSVVAPTDQHRVLSSLRGTEVVSDPTNVLALECAQRLSRDPRAIVKLATSMRVIRAQQVPDKPGHTQHFRIFTFVTAGRERADHALSADALAAHVRTLCAAFDRLELHGYRFGKRRVVVLATPARSALADRVVDALAGTVDTERAVLEHPYYSGGLRYMFWVRTSDGDEVPLADGGTFDWLAELTQNRGNVFVASGMGAQLVPLAFRAGTPTASR
jgi:hypothetical protein